MSAAAVSASGDALVADAMRDTERWITESYHAAAEACRCFQPTTIEQAFAINHCAYVSTSAGIEEDDGAEYMNILSKIAPTFHHYRFQDTLAKPLSQQAEVTVEQIGMTQLRDRPEHARRLLATCELLEEAQAVLVKGRPFFGDEEVKSHLYKVLRLQSKLGCRA